MSDKSNFIDLDFSNLDPIIQFYCCIRIALIGIRCAEKLISSDNNSLNKDVD